MRTFAGIEDKYAGYEDSSVLLLPVPYDGTSTWGKGADKGFELFLEASENMELYDIETDSEVYKNGVHILPAVDERSSPESVYQALQERTLQLLQTGKFLTFFGGEHSISIGIIEAFRHKYPNLTVLQLDAHTDLREEYNGSKFNHACAMHMASRSTNLVQVGIRSMDACEKQFLKKENCFFAADIAVDEEWGIRSIDRMTENVYISIDLDVLDPAIMPSTGTPEPGGFSWFEIINYLKEVFLRRNVVGFDIVEFAPIDNLRAPDFLVSKLYYQLLSFKFSYGQ